MKDIVPKKSIRHIPLPEKKPIIHTHADEKRVPLRKVADTAFARSLPPVRTVNHENYVPRKPRRKGPWFIAAAILLSIGLMITIFSVVFSGATISVTPKTNAVELAATFAATNSKDLKGSDLPYEIISIKETGAGSVPAKGNETVSKKATGTIVIFNETTSAQRLVKNTRFESSGGLTYRSDKTVTVPAVTKAASGSKTPGKIEVIIYADAPGASYNIGLSDFSVPGFKGTDKAKLVYARAKTEIAGGFEGNVKKILPEDREVAKKTIEDTLRKELTASAFREKTDMFVLFNDAIKITFKEMPDVAEGESVKIAEEGVLEAYIFNRDLLSRAIAGKAVEDYAKGPVTVTGIDTLSFSPKVSTTDNAPLPKTGALTFALKGPTTVIELYNEDALKKALAGKSKKDLASVLTQFRTISKMDVVLRPFWKRSFPDDVGRIKIK